MISKEMFICCIDTIQQQEIHDHECVDAFQTILNEDRVVIGYDNSKISIQFVNLLVAVMNDKGQWIEYFIYELDYGEKYKVGCATNEDKSPIDLSTIEKLYEFLIKEYDNN